MDELDGVPTDQPMFEIDGEQVPYDQVSPDQVKEWYDAVANNENWQASNTQKSQELAETMSQIDELGGLEKIKEELAEFEEIDTFLEANPEFEQITNKYIDDKQAASAGQQVPDQQAPDQQVPDQQVPGQETDQHLVDLKNRLWALEQSDKDRKDKDSEREESDKNIGERKAALAALAEKDPNFDQKKLEEFIEGLSGLDNLTGLYNFAYSALKGSDTGELRQQVQKDLETEKLAQTETGELGSARDLPENTDASRDYDEIFDEFKSGLGIDVGV